MPLCFFKGHFCPHLLSKKGTNPRPSLYKTLAAAAFLTWPSFDFNLALSWDTLAPPPAKSSRTKPRLQALWGPQNIHLGGLTLGPVTTGMQSQNPSSHGQQNNGVDWICSKLLLDKKESKDSSESKLWSNDDGRGRNREASHSVGVQVVAYAGQEADDGGGNE